ncbi:expressed unknown protein [Seminavis robusta]|uniref:Uncharacterized protein n=1 Tax=Seminavis robusta TaxID=568900 RepID=A0A9N8H386_9STRA|nr:expressed unknown protein [Seminavis robusta]|eukprot:Sro33_g021420.1 n/a (94) ;mRNA; f:75330-75611
MKLFSKLETFFHHGHSNKDASRNNSPQRRRGEAAPSPEQSPARPALMMETDDINEWYQAMHMLPNESDFHRDVSNSSNGSRARTRSPTKTTRR